VWSSDQLKRPAFEFECRIFGAYFIYYRIRQVDYEEHYHMFKCTLDQPESGFISTIAFETNVKKVISGMRNEPYLSDGVHVYQTQPDGSLQA